MTQKQYERERERLLRYYEKIEKKYIHEQTHSTMLSSLQREKNERLALLTERFHKNGV